VRLTATGFTESYEWDFADGTTATGKNAKHTYTSTGEMTIHSAWVGKTRLSIDFKELNQD
jgi:hypothetical protein